MASNGNVGKGTAVYSLSLGLTYLIFGLLELSFGLDQAWNLDWLQWNVSSALIYPDMFGGCMLIIIGVVFLFGVSLQRHGNQEGISFLVVGTILAMVFFVVHMAIMASHAIGYSVYHVTPEPYADPVADWAEWSWLDDLRPAIWLFVFALPGVQLMLQTWRKKDSI